MTDERFHLVQQATKDSPIIIIWYDALRESEQAPDPHFLDGVDLDISEGAEKTCTVKLPHPARRCGAFKIHCLACDQIVAVTTAGRADDPRSVKFACKEEKR